MSSALELVVRTILIGVVATTVLDLWSLLATRLFGFPPANWALVGRWIGHFPQGRFVHESIAAALPVRHELLIGWVTHYVIGVVYAAVLAVAAGSEWLNHPSLLPAHIVAWIALVAPFFIMQPGMGAGIAASRTPHPGKARLRSVLAHTAFGLGLYLAALLGAAFLPPF